VGILRRGAYVMAAQIVAVLLGIVTSIVVSRELGPLGRGVLALFAVGLQTATAVATLGVSFSFAFFVGKRRFPIDALVGSALLISLGLAAVVALVAIPPMDWLLRTALEGLERWHLLLLVGSMPFAFLGLLLQNVLLGEGRVEETAVVSAVRSLLTTAALVAVLTGMHLGVGAAIVVTALSNVAYAGMLGWKTLGRHGLSVEGFPEIARSVFSYGLRLYPGQLSSHFWLRADLYLLNLVAGPAMVGQYTLATGLAEKLWILEGSAMQSVLPEMIASERRAAAALAARTARTLCFAGGACSVALAALSPWLVPFVYGDDFRPAVLPLILLLPGVTALSVARVFSGFYSGQLGRPLVPTVVAIVTACLSALLYALLIPAFGMTGAAVASSLSYAFPLLVYMRKVPSDTGLRIREFLVVNRSDAALLRASAIRLAGRLRTIV
jgi:O-antigen/teichoic acid export membrane protein